MITRTPSGLASGVLRVFCLAGVGLWAFDGLFGAAPTGIVTISGTPQVGQTLTVSNDLADADGLGVISYQWYRDGVPIVLGGTLKDGVNGVDGLGAARKVTLSPDGNYAYVTAHDDDAVSWYERNASTGALTYGGMVKDGVGGADGLDGANSVALSAHGEYAYVSGPADSAVSWYERNSTTGALTFGGMAKDGVGGFNGLNYAGDIVLSKDGNRGYVTALDKLIWFEHNQTTGTLELGGSLSDGVGGVDGLHRARGVSLSPDGLHLYVVGNYDQTISWFEYNSGSEVLSFVGLLRDGIGGVDGLGGPRATAISPDGVHVYVTTEGDDAIGWFERNASTGSLSYGGMVKDGVGGVDGLDNAQAIAISPGGRFAYATSVTENSVSWFNRNPVTGSLTFGGLLKDGINGVDGLAMPRSVALSSDDMYAYVTGTDDDAVSWFTRDPATGALLYGSASDANYTLTQADLGKTITVVASYVDGATNPESVSSAGSSSVNPLPLSDPGSIQPGNLKLWLDANHSSASGSTWNDRSASSNHATKNGSPTLIPNAQNGLPVMRYAGVSGQNHSWSTISDVRTVFWVVYRKVGSQSSMLGDLSSSHFHTNTNIFWNANYAHSNIKEGSLWVKGSIADGTTQNVPSALSVISLRTIGAVTASNFSNDRNIAGRSWDGDLAELIIYNKALSDAEIQKIEGYLAHKWGLTHQLPFSHPYKYGAVTISGTPLVGETLTVSNDLADPDGVGTVTYQWFRDGLSVNMLKDGVNGVDGLDGAWGVTLSADGQHAYVTGGSDDAISWYERNASTGALTYGGMLKEGVNGVDGLDGAWGVTLSGDGQHAYVAGQVDNAVSWFERNASTGALTYGGMLKDGVGGVDGLWGARGVTLSGDGQHAYVTGQNDTAVSWYERNASTGALSYVGMLKEGVGGVDGLWGARGVTLSGDGQHAYVTGHADDAVSWYERNASTGALTYGGMLKDGVGGVDGLDFAFDLTLSADGNHSYVTGSEDDAVSWYERNATTGALTYGGMLKDGVGVVDGLDNAGGVTLSGDGQHAYVTGQNDSAVSWYERNASTGVLSCGGMLKDGVGGVDGLNGAWNVTLSADGNHAYVTGGTDDAISWYERNSSTGALSFGSPSNSNYTLTAIDAGSVISVVASYANGNGTAKNMTSLYSQTVNTRPTNLNSIAPLTMAENQPTGSLVGEFNATDPDAGATLTYHLVRGAGDGSNSLFTLETNGTLKTATVFDYETNASTYSIRVQAKDEFNATVEGNFTVTLTDDPSDEQTIPVITVTSPTYETPIPVSISFEKLGVQSNVSGFSFADVSVVNATVSNFSGSGHLYTFDLTPVSDPVNISVSIPQGAASDGTNPTGGAFRIIEYKWTVTRQSDLTLWYKFDETTGTSTTDSTGGGSGTLMNMDGSDWVPGKFGNALDFDGSDDFIQPTLASHPFGPEVTIAFWAFGGSSLPKQTSVLGSGNSDTTLNIYFPWNNGTIYWDAGPGDGSYDRINKGASSGNYKGSWQHWAFTKNASTGMMHIFLNGGLWHSGTGKGKVVATGGVTNFKIGSDKNGSNNWHGKLDDFRIYDKELIYSEIAAIYGNGSGDLNASAINNPPTDTNATAPLTLANITLKNLRSIAPLTIVENQQIDAIVGEFNATDPYASTMVPKAFGNLKLWLDANDTSYMNTDYIAGNSPPVNNTAVGFWMDKSGNNNHAIALSNSAANRPTYIENGFNGSSPTLHFNGDYMAVANSAASFDGWDKMTVFVVVDEQANQTWRYWFGKASVFNSSSGNVWSFRARRGDLNPPAYDFQVHGTSAIDSIESTSMSIHDPGIMVFTYGQGKRTMHLNNQLLIDSVDSGSMQSINSVPLTLGGLASAASGANLHISEFIVYNDVVTELGRELMEGYLAHKWGLVSSLPSGHLHKLNAPSIETTLTYHLVSGAGDTHNTLFTLETNGTLKTATIFDYESNASTYSIRVQAKDEFNATVEGNFTVTLTDIDDSFTDITSEVGISVGGVGAWGDFDNDGDVDLLTSSKLYNNEGNGSFLLSGDTFAAGSAIWVDVDNDRDLDLFTHTGSTGSAQFYINQGNGWSEQSAAMGLTPGGEAASWGDYDQDGDMDLFLTRSSGAPTNDIIFRNDNLSFTQVQSSLGLNYSTFGRRSGWVDYDGDGDLDLHALAGNGSSDLLFRNTSGSFQNVASAVGLAFGTNGNSSAWGDLDGDGDLDGLFTFGDSAPLLLKNNGSTFNSFPGSYAINTNIIEGYASFLDVDCDGDTDLIMPSSGGYDVYKNTGSGLEVQPLLTGQSTQGYNISYADYDGDGDLDLLVYQSSVLLLRNNSNPSPDTYLKIVPVVGDKLRNAYGATVRLYAADNSILGSSMIDVGLGNQDEYGAWFYGLSPGASYQVEVVFPTGTTVRSSSIVPRATEYIMNESGTFINLNQIPTGLNATAPLTIAENQPIGTTVGEFNATDTDAGATLTYHLVSGAGDGNNSLFTLEANGTLKTASTFDYESNASTYSIRVQAKDEFNATVEGNFTVVLTDVYEPSQPPHSVPSASNLEMIWVEPGTFTMGSPTSETGRGTDEIEHNVTLTKGFYFGKYEVTQAQYQAVMTGNGNGLSATPSNWPGNPNRPVEQVSWDDVQIFLTRLNASEQAAGRLPSGWKYVLPTEAQWEYACRAGTMTAYSWGASIANSNANYNWDGAWNTGSDFKQTRDVGQYAANPWGFFDMHGNVWEWVHDWKAAYPSGNPVVDPTGPASGSYRVQRGGPWAGGVASLRSAQRSNTTPSNRGNGLGFRVGFQQIMTPPTNLNTTASLTIAENQPIGTVVGDFNATDPDAGATLTYHLVSGVGDGNNSLFTLEANGTLKTASTFDYESNASTYSIRVQAKDEFNATVEGNFTVTLTDVYEPSQANHIVDLNSSVNLEMIWVEPGTFTMGDSDISNASPEHNVTLTKGFYLGKYEVTQAQYEAVMVGNDENLSPTPSQWPNNPNRPVEKVSWQDIQVFITRLNDQQAGSLPVGWAYELPSEAEWEYACRAGTTTAYSWGNWISATDANWNHGADANQTEDVGQYNASPWGFFDMHGNVWEWVADAYLTYSSGAQTDPFDAGATDSKRIRRGGSWYNGVGLMPLARRVYNSPSYRTDHIGFRLAFRQITTPPSDLNTTAPLTFAENQPLGTVVGEFNATDPDAGATLTYHLVNGAGDTHNALFTLDTNGTLKTATTFDYESNASTYSIRVQAKDEFNASVEGNFTVELTDLYEVPPGQSNNDGNSSSDGNSTTGETNPVVDGNTTTDLNNPVVDGNSSNEGNATIPAPVPDYFRPIVDTLPVGEVNGATAKLHGSVMDTGGLTPTEFGFLLSSRPNPKESASGVIRLAAESNGSSFSAVAVGLMAGKTYYFRAFAVNAEGIGYGFEESFATPAGPRRPTWIEAVPGTVKGWWTSPWLGNFYLNANGWARHEKLGWVFPVQSPSAGLWLWKEGFGWLWTDEAVYPFLYRNTSGGWLYFYGRRKETLLFYDYSTKDWIIRQDGQ